jgi:phenylalanyl-tRNA synthetase beta chain
MKISYNWLQKYLKIDLSIEKISTLLTDIGLEVEGIHLHENVKGGLKGIKIGQVITKLKHPDADKLNITTVDVGDEEYLQIVCGAPNIDVGQKVPVATVGTLLYSAEESFKIKKSKIRGVLSNGMICSENELGLGISHEGIMILDKSAKVGISGADFFEISSDNIFDIGLTPNRSDAMSHIGVARDLKAVLNHNGAKLSMCTPSIANFKVDNNFSKIHVEILDDSLCPRYSAVCISDLKVEESPKWLRDSLLSIGVNPINNIVDITNYVLHETGQPLHAFDTEKIIGNKVIVKHAIKDELFRTLDNVERKLDSSDLMICNSKAPMCIAGVFGGNDSGVSSLTTKIFLESAYFNPVSIRKSSKRHNLNTDASFRYERGCDPNITVYALKRAALLIKEICGGNISSEIIDLYPKKIKDCKINLNYSTIDDLVGEVINRDTIKNIILNLEIIIVNESKDSLELIIPTYRVDVTREVDVIEEILRIYGFNNIKIPTKLNSSINTKNIKGSHFYKNLISDLLSSNGFNEIMNNSLSKESYTNLNSEFDTANNINIINPLSNDLSVLRRSAVFSGLETIKYNINRNNINLKLYEFGKTYFQKEDLNIENEFLSVFISGNQFLENWNSDNVLANFYSLKEKVDHILNRLALNKFKSNDINNSIFQNGLEYKIKKQTIVSFGNVNSSILNHFKITSSVLYAEFNWDLILELISSKNIKYKPVTKFPVVRRDLALVVDKEIQFSQFEKIAKSLNNNLLQKINLFDVYEGDKLGDNKKSYAISFILSDSSKTLNDKTIESVMSKLLNSFQNELGAVIRS